LAVGRDRAEGPPCRLFGIRCEERDGGVYVEIEGRLLNRDIPVSLRWVAGQLFAGYPEFAGHLAASQTENAVRTWNLMLDTETRKTACTGHENGRRRPALA